MSESSDGYLSLGGPTAPMSSRAAPARALDATFTINPARPVLVAYLVRITCPAAPDRGRVDLVSDIASPPTTVLASCGGGVAAAGTIFEATLIGLVYPGQNVRLITTQVAGTPTFALVSTSETTL